MADSKKNIPQIRFKGFEEEWETKFLNELCLRITRKNSNLESKLPLTISSIYGLVDQISYFNNRVASNNITGYYLIKKGEFAYNKSSSDGYPVGSVKRLDLYDKGVLSTLYIVFGIKDDTLVSDYLVSYFSTPLWYKQILDRASEGARNHGLLNIATNDFFSISISKPKTQDEQTSVANFFRTLDTLISNRQKKLESLRNLKKSCLTKMFPQNGSKVPEIRFKGFDGEWEEKKLGEIMKDFIVPMRDKPKIFDGNIPWCRIEDIEGKYIRDTKSNQYVSKKTIIEMNLKIIPKGSLIVSASATFGVVAIVENDLITNQTFIGLVPKTGYDLDFLYVFFLSADVSNKMKEKSAGSTIFYIPQNEFRTLTSCLPSYEEQLKIGSYFHNLDNMISTKEKEIEKLKNLKKACLDKMFI